MIILASGLGRCGSSLTMQMLHAGGIPCEGEAPAFECRDAIAAINTGDAHHLSGHAVKLLDPFRRGWRPMPGPDYRIIWLDRDPKQQAKSQAKFMDLMGISRQRPKWRVVMSKLRSDRRSSWRTLNKALDVNGQILKLRFERILTHPMETALKIQDIVGRPLDVDAMAACVLPRGPECMPDLAIELALSRGYDVII